MTFLIKPEIDRQGSQSAYSASERYHAKRLQENPSGVLWDALPPTKGREKILKSKFLRVQRGQQIPPSFQRKVGCQKSRSTRAHLRVQVHPLACLPAFITVCKSTIEDSYNGVVTACTSCALTVLRRLLLLSSVP